MVLSRVRLIRVKLVLVNLNPINHTYTVTNVTFCHICHSSCISGVVTAAVTSCEDEARRSGEGVSWHVANCRHRRGANYMWRWGHARTCCCQASARDGYASALSKPKKASAVKKPAARERRQHLLLPPLLKKLEPLKQRRLIQVELHCLQQEQFLSRHPRPARHSPWCRTLPIRALLVHPARVQPQTRSAILPVSFVPQVPS